MAAPTQYYVDPSIAGDSGTGSSGDPYGDLEYCLEQITRDATNGDQINIKAGTTETLEFALDIEGDYGAPTAIAPIIFRGYTSAANDGGIGTISGGGTVSIFTHSSADYTHFVDLHLTNTGANAILNLDIGCIVCNCELDTTSGRAIDVDTNCMIVNNYIHTATGTHGIYSEGGRSLICGNMVVAAVTTAGIYSNSGGDILNNIVKLAATNSASGIMFIDDISVINNSIFATAGTGNGISGTGTGRDGNRILNNIVEGFNGAGGAGYSGSSTDHHALWGHNAAYNNTTDDESSSAGVEIMVDIGGDDIPLSASAFTDPSTNDFSVGTEVKATGAPNFTGGGTTPGTTQYMDMGAAQRQEAGGGGGGCKLAGASGGMAG